MWCWRPAGCDSSRILTQSDTWASLYTRQSYSTDFTVFTHPHNTAHTSKRKLSALKAVETSFYYFPVDLYFIVWLSSSVLMSFIGHYKECLWSLSPTSLYLKLGVDNIPHFIKKTNRTIFLQLNLISITSGLMIRCVLASERTRHAMRMLKLKYSLRNMLKRFKLGTNGKLGTRKYKCQDRILKRFECVSLY